MFCGLLCIDECLLSPVAYMGVCRDQVFGTRSKLSFCSHAFFSRASSRQACRLSRPKSTEARRSAETRWQHGRCKWRPRCEASSCSIGCRSEAWSPWASYGCSAPPSRGIAPKGTSEVCIATLVRIGTAAFNICFALRPSGGMRVSGERIVGSRLLGLTIALGRPIANGSASSSAATDCSVSVLKQERHLHSGGA